MSYKSKFTGAEIDARLEKALVAPVLPEEFIVALFSGNETITDALYQEIDAILGLGPLAIAYIEGVPFLFAVVRHSGPSGEHTYLTSYPMSSSGSDISFIILYVSESTMNGVPGSDHEISMEFKSLQ